MRRIGVLSAAMLATAGLASGGLANSQAAPSTSAMMPDISCQFGPYIVFFDMNSVAITPYTAETLDNVVSGYFNCGGDVIMLEGHSDGAGSAAYNQGLSARRTQAVADYLIGKGVPASKIVQTSYGESRPRVPQPDGVAEPQNRRVEITGSR
jgi:outer membrane protein OmpA-like peptidoglycan-associated protein